MAHIGPVQFDGSDGLQTNPTARSGKTPNRERKLPLPRGAQNALVLVTPGRKAESARTAASPAESARTAQPLRLRPSSEPTPAAEWPVQSGKARLVSRFLTWCFPVREFSSPMQRILYLSMEGPRIKRQKRIILR